jgi:hypothetical protein
LNGAVAAQVVEVGVEQVFHFEVEEGVSAGRGYMFVEAKTA